MGLYTPLAGKLSAFCFSKTHSREEAKELVSETILASYENFHSLKNDTAFLCFLFTIASNIYRAKYKRNKRFVLAEPVIFDELLDESVLQDDKTDIRILYEALDKLPENQKEAIYLFDIIGMNQKEVAAIQKTSVINVKLRIHRGKNRLKEMLDDKQIFTVVNSEPFNVLQES